MSFGKVLRELDTIGMQWLQGIEIIGVIYELGEGIEVS
ncbi:hypothetical protein OROMI_021013 [Orobanche minor]